MAQIVFNKVYKEAKLSKARYRIIYGGAGSGKSRYVAQETILCMLENKEYSYLIVRKTGKSIRNTAFQELSDVIELYDLGKLFKINQIEMSITCSTGARLISSGLDNVEKLKSVTGINRIWVEEASEITEKDLVQLNLRLRGVNEIGYQITLTFNPISELHWIKRRFFDVGQPNTFILKTTYLDNKFIDDEYKASLESMKIYDPNEYRIYALGEWGSMGNMIFTNWEKQDLRELKKGFDNYFYGLDFGFADDPTAFLAMHYDSKKKIIYITDEWFEKGAFIDDIAKEIQPYVKDDIVTCDSSEPRSIADLKRHNIKAYGAKKGPGSIEHSIKWIQGHKIIIDEFCVNMIKELSSYKWRQDKDGNAIPKPVDKDDHGISAMRYGLERLMTQSKYKWLY